jgi:hypothetical protein
MSMPMPMPIPTDPRSPPMLVDSPERIGQHTLQCSQKWQQQKKKKKAPNRPQMDWELVHTGCRVGVRCCRCCHVRVVVFGCRVGLSCRFVVSVCRVRFPPCLPASHPSCLPSFPYSQSSQPKSSLTSHPSQSIALPGVPGAEATCSKKVSLANRMPEGRALVDLTISEKSGLRGILRLGTVSRKGWRPQ